MPFVSSYRPFWLGLGAVAFDLLLAVILTSLLRARVGPRVWRATHWLAYACWPVALLHTLGTGSDVRTTWLLALSVACLAVVLAAVLVRALGSWAAVPRTGARLRARRRCAFTVGLLLWLPSGPLGSEWARRSGTPASLLGHSSASRSSSSSRIVVNP